jgi:hypothetical protein
LPPTSAEPADIVEGSLDEVNEQVLVGWAWNSRTPGTPLNLEIYSDETRLLTVRADEFREDLQNEGIGKHGFSVPTPAVLKDGKPHMIFLKLKGTGRILARRTVSISQVNDVGRP